MAAKGSKFDGLMGLSKGSTYRLDPEKAFELEVYGVIKKYGTKKKILEDSLELFFKKNKISPELRKAAILILQGGAER